MEILKHLNGDLEIALLPYLGERRAEITGRTKSDSLQYVEIRWESMWEYIGNVGIGPGFPEVQDLRRRRRPVREPRPHDVICQTQTPGAPGAAATATRVPVRRDVRTPCFRRDDVFANSLTTLCSAIPLTNRHDQDT